MTRIQSYGKATDLLTAVQDCVIRRLSHQESLQILEAKGFPMSESKFKRIKAHLKNSTKDRLNFIAYEEFASQHVEAIDTLKMQNNELMIVQSQTTNPHVKVRCAEVIRENLRLLAELYDANPFVGNLVDKLNTVHTTQIHD